MADSGEEAVAKAVSGQEKDGLDTKEDSVGRGASDKAASEPAKEKEAPESAAVVPMENKAEHDTKKDAAVDASSRESKPVASETPSSVSSAAVTLAPGPITAGPSSTTKSPPPTAAATGPVAPKAAPVPPPPVIVPPSSTTKPVPSKKRKLSTPAGGAPTPPPPAITQRPIVTPHTPLADPAVVKCVHDVMGLLQTYGPLTFGQLEYNLPPISSLQDILQIMATIGVVQVVDDDDNNNSSESTVRYTMLNGIPRSDVVLPQTVVDDILDAQTEVTRSKERCRMLKDALLSETKPHPREVMKQVLLKFPEIANDPVYMAALRNVHVDVAAVDRERIKQQRLKETATEEAEEDSKDAEGKEAAKEVEGEVDASKETEGEGEALKGSTQPASVETTTDTPVEKAAATEQKPTDETKKDDKQKEEEATQKSS